MKYFTHWFICLSVLAAPAYAGREGGSGTIGGGEQIAGYLRDLVDGGTCIVEMGNDFVKREAPKLEPMLKSLDQTHWILALHLRTEINQLRICVIKNRLKRIRTNDVDGLTAYHEDSRMVAIRLDDTVFIERAGFRALKPASRAMLMIHEAMHSYIPWETERRNTKLRNIVNAIYENGKKPMSAEKFALQLEYSEVAVAPLTAEYDNLENEYKTLFAEQSTEDERMKAAAAIDEKWALFVGGSYYRDGTKLIDGTYLSAAQEKYSNLLWNKYQAALNTGDVSQVAHYLDLGALAIRGKNALSYAHGDFWQILDTKNTELLHFFTSRFSIEPNEFRSLGSRKSNLYPTCPGERIYQTPLAKTIRADNREMFDALLSLADIDITLGFRLKADRLRKSCQQRLFEDFEKRHPRKTYEARFSLLSLAVESERLEYVKVLLAHPKMTPEHVREGRLIVTYFTITDKVRWETKVVNLLTYARIRENKQLFRLLKPYWMDKSGREIK